MKSKSNKNQCRLFLFEILICTRKIKRKKKSPKGIDNKLIKMGPVALLNNTVKF